MAGATAVDVLTARGYTQLNSWAVVGNGPISEADRKAIDRADVVVRFNDLNHLKSNERTDLHVIRHPSWWSFKHVSAPKWDVGYAESELPRDAELVTYVYEAQHTTSNTLLQTARVFPACDCRASCLQASTWAGPSTGAAILSELQGYAEVKKIDVYGFNGMGDPRMHVDFANRSMISGCCTKCHIHRTASTNYGNEGAIAGFVAIGVGAALGLVCFLFAARRVIRGMRKPDTGQQERPLLALS